MGRLGFLFLLTFACVASDGAMAATAVRPSRAATGANARVASEQNPRAGTRVVATRAGGAVTSRAQSLRARAASTNTRVATRQNTASASSKSVVARAGTSGMSVVDAMRATQSATDACRAAYTECMDNFCNVLDDNQGRCSCSANLDNYADVADAQKQTTKELQNIAQQIQYIGLTADEIEAIFAQTAAEDVMSGASDNSTLSNDLEKLKDMIVDVQSGRATSSATATTNVDLSGLLNFDISNTGFNMGSLFSTQSSNTASVSNQRGTALYKTAVARCRAAVLNECEDGVDLTAVTNAYDLEIDKHCMAYERALTTSNEEMASTVRNAKNVLQRARLTVAQQKNQYDLRGCVNALDECMQSDFVCGDGYEDCLDHTGKYIFEGDVVVGSKPGGGNMDAAIWGNETSVINFVNSTIATDASSFNNASANISIYLQNKIGYHDDASGKNYGLCMGVLNKCQDLTYIGTGDSKNYNFSNTVVKEYLQRTLVTIKNKQNAVLNEYKQTCVSDVKTCLGNASISGNITSTSISACTNVINTCRSLTNAASVATVTDTKWVQSLPDVTLTTVECLKLGEYLTNNTCKRCENGYYCPAGQSARENCGAGYYCVNNVKTACEHGKYQCPGLNNTVPGTTVACDNALTFIK